MGQEKGHLDRGPRKMAEPGDEQINAITDDGTGMKRGQDHSTEHHEETEPTGGVGAIQDREDTGSDIARIRDES
jgi:hypothetical protein